VAGGYATHTARPAPRENDAGTRVERGPAVSEKGKSKGQRLFIFAFAAVIVALVMVPVAASIGSSLAAPFDNSVVLSGQSGVTSIWANDTYQIPFTQNTTSHAYEFSYPATYYSAYLVTNLTVEELQAYSVGSLVLDTSDSGAGNVTFGLGTNAATFTPYALVPASKMSSVTIALSPAWLLGNQSEHVMLEVATSVVTLSVSVAAHGNTGLSSWFGPALAENVGYILGGIAIFGFGLLAMPWADIDIRKIRGTASMLTRRRATRRSR
jgi:hypothetical protein